MVEMGNRVYDPIHDVFQTQPSEGHDKEGAGAGRTGSMLSKLKAEGELVPSLISSKHKLKESSKYNRHLKKPDGAYFNRSDVQFRFLYLLLSDKRLLFTNIYKSFFRSTVVPIQTDEPKVVNVTDEGFDARCFIFNDTLTFSQAYILALATSSKCSKILKDKLLRDKEVAFSSCALGILVNVGRMNTTINFFHEMTSQLRTFHSVPCLQMNNTDPKALQDTPRLKSILKSAAVGNDPIDLMKVYDHEEQIQGKSNLINLIFALCDNVSLLNIILLKKYVDVDPGFSSLYSLLDSSKYDPVDRCNVLLWLLYIHSETDMTDVSVRESLTLFRGAFPEEEKLMLRLSEEDYDVDTPEEVEYGLQQMQKRKEFLKSHKSGAEPKDGEGNKENSEGSEKATTSPPSSPSRQPSVTAATVKKQDPESNGPAKKRPRVKKEASAEPAAKLKSPSKDKEVVQRRNLARSWIEADNAKMITKGLDVAKEISQHQFLKDLAGAQEYARLKRKEVGLMKAFSEFEDISLANLLGVRGRKRKKFKDNLLGFETDYIKYFGLLKKKILANERLDATAAAVASASPDSDDEPGSPVFKLR
ncbi:hypothetical protein TPHA_0P00320 [Tetrapisispora phaffii CBS 4417]|uniref:Ino eighty subunit 1 n=1 Tax=Tetrapisispora phaffii (strain ATCC 24235 / CBS 4417 / NBRC 1672 / NRRL Y-8282 / UCD 70-5) TaxID=1071381 RepID=G8C212_TETPH|nr:hypothetical protein TPHA_0P00320 [Tetrapisispora phaffii CBS 4417]CCE66190.1 hypothetical protein TPHA_0P00320 [Tetrapisispora phaffii CBS 4417]